MFEKDEERKKTMEETWKTVSVPGYLKAMEKVLVARGGKHFAGNKVHLNTMLNIHSSVFNNFFKSRNLLNIIDPLAEPNYS